jgi:hypothetical protein
MRSKIIKARSEVARGELQEMFKGVNKRQVPGYTLRPEEEKEIALPTSKMPLDVVLDAPPKNLPREEEAPHDLHNSVFKTPRPEHRKGLTPLFTSEEHPDVAVRESLNQRDLANIKEGLAKHRAVFENSAALMPDAPPHMPLAGWLDYELGVRKQREATASPRQRKLMERIRKSPWGRRMLTALAFGLLAGEANYVSEQPVPQRRIEDPNKPMPTKAPEVVRTPTTTAPAPLSLSGTVRIEANPEGAARMLVDFFTELKNKEPVVYDELARGKKPRELAWNYVKRNGFLKEEGELTLSGVVRPGDHIVMDGFGHVMFETKEGEKHLLTDEHGNPAKGAVNDSWIDYR